jgi:hypothetical protein
MTSGDVVKVDARAPAASQRCPQFAALVARYDYPAEMTDSYSRWPIKTILCLKNARLGRTKLLLCHKLPRRYRRGRKQGINRISESG